MEKWRVVTMNLKQLLTNLNPFKKKEVEVESLPIEVPEKQLLIKPLSKGSHYSTEQQTFIAECIGHHMNSTEISFDFEDAFGMKLNNPNKIVDIYKKSPTFKPIIEAARKKFESNPHPTAGSYKSVRLERVERAHKIALAARDWRGINASVEQIEKGYAKNEGGTVNVFNAQFINMSPEEREHRKEYLAKKLKLIKEVSNGNGGVEGEVGKQG